MLPYCHTINDRNPRCDRRPLMKWVTRERPKIDRLACPWLIRRFIDQEAEIHYVPAAAFLAKYHLEEAALARLAEIVRAADTDTLDRSAQAPGLLAISLGLAVNITDDQELLKTALPLYDALYTWCRSLDGEHHGWYPQTILNEMGR